MASSLQPFMEKYCIDCHNGDKHKGEVRLDNLDYKIAQYGSASMWSDVLDTLNVGEMPPKKADQPKKKELTKAISLITDQLLLARKRFSSTDGQITMRHLNKREYYGSINDLIGLNIPSNYLDDDLSPNFDTYGADQFFSTRSYENYMNVGKKIMKEALKVYSLNISSPKKSKFAPGARAYNRQQKALKKLEDTMNLINSGASIEEIGLGDSGQISLFKKRYERAVSSAKTYLAIEDHKKGVTSEFTEKFGRNTYIKPGAKYIYRLHGKSKNDALIKVYAQNKEIGIIPFKASNQSQTYEFSFSLDELSSRTHVGFNMGHLKGLYIEYDEIEGPFESESSFAETLFKPILAQKNVNKDELKGVLTTFAERAFRYQSFDETFIDALVQIYDDGKDAGKKEIDALVTPLAMIISSPSFLYLKESSSGNRFELNQQEFAIRMAYFLWSSPPDQELYKIAKANKLYELKTLQAQFDRMIKSPKAERFLESFINQWIGIQRYDEVDLPNKLLGDFQTSARKELGEYFKILVKENLPIDKFIDSDFVVVNQTLADYYKIDGKLNGFEKVVIPATSPRGGLLSQAAFHIMGSAASRTSPSIRGTLIREAILHDPPAPPPANVPEIDSSQQGNISVRNLVNHHQKLPQCASCHAKIDPLGLGLENFDYLGQWRDHEFIGREKRGRKWTKGKKLPIDASGYISETRPFKNFKEFKRQLMDNKENLAESLYSSLVSYGIGREIEFIDEEEITNNLIALKENNFLAKDMIFQVVQSRLFRTK